LVIGLVNIFLFISLLIFNPRCFQKISFKDFFQAWYSNLKYLLIIIIIVVVHLIEVNIVDSYTTNWIGIDFAQYIHVLENGFVFWFSQNYIFALVVFFVIMYIAVYPFTLWFSPMYFLFTNDKNALRFLAYGLLLIYIITLPFYLFFPVSNVYTYFQGQSALESVIPGVNQFFFSTTTYNNCIPSLHVAVSLLIAKSISITKNKKFTYFGYFCAVSVIISVIYLAIHWIIDVISGIIIAISIFYLLEYILKGKEFDKKIREH